MFSIFRLHDDLFAVNDSGKFQRILQDIIYILKKLLSLALIFLIPSAVI